MVDEKVIKKYKEGTDLCNTFSCYEDCDICVEKYLAYIEKKGKLISENQLKAIKLVGKIQFNILAYRGSSDGMIGFDYNGMFVVNPFMNEDGRDDVEPISYYGEAFINSPFIKEVKDF